MSLFAQKAKAGEVIPVYESWFGPYYTDEFEIVPNVSEGRDPSVIDAEGGENRAFGEEGDGDGAVALPPVARSSASPSTRAL